MKDDGGFRSCEHILAEALGNRRLILPPGLVCDECNHERLSVLDQALVEFPPVMGMLLLRGVPRKQDRLPTAKWANAEGYIDLEHGVPVIDAQTARAWHPRPGGGTLRVQKSWGKSQRQRARVGRALYKIGLEFVYYTDGEMAFDRGFDELRGVVLGDPPVRGWFGVVKDAKPHDKVHIGLEGHLVEADGLLVLEVDFYGTVVFTEILQRRSADAEIVRRLADLGPADIITF